MPLEEPLMPSEVEARGDSIQRMRNASLAAALVAGLLACSGGSTTSSGFGPPGPTGGGGITVGGTGGGNGFGGTSASTAGTGGTTGAIQYCGLPDAGTPIPCSELDGGTGHPGPDGG